MPGWRGSVCGRSPASTGPVRALFGVVDLGPRGEAVGGDPDKRMSVLGPHVFDGVPLMRSAASAGVPLRTAQRWLAAYTSGGAAGLSRAPRSDRAQRRRMPAELVTLVEGWALRRPPPRIAEVHREAAGATPTPRQG